ncbi:hypothetical protein FRC11_005172 [Ceratobasidium sp. 423]|nr:hypothetical protein FRC11_005172 [Ceratobasidium sp. 423]
MPLVLDSTPPDDPQLEGPNSFYGAEENATTHTQQHVHSPAAGVPSPRLFHPGASSTALGIALWMNVPPGLQATRQAIANYIEEFKRELDRFKAVLHAEAKYVVCSLCSKEHGSKPSNLERHLRHHLAVKPYKCRRCPQGLFTTKDQAVVHVVSNHHLVRAIAWQDVEQIE